MGDSYEPVAREAVRVVDDAMAGLVRVAFMSQGDQRTATSMMTEWMKELAGESARLHRMLDAAGASRKVVEMGNDNQVNEGERLCPTSEG